MSGSFIIVKQIPTAEAFGNGGKLTNLISFKLWVSDFLISFP